MMKHTPKVLMLIESSRESGRRLIAGVSNYANRFGSWDFYWDPQGINHLSRAYEGIRFDGILARNVGDLGAYADLNIPTITFSYGDAIKSNTVFVTTDNEAIGQTVAEYYLARGFKHFAFCGQPRFPWSVERGEAYQRFLGKLDYPVEMYWTIPPLVGKTVQQQELDALGQWLDQLPKPVGIMASNDDFGRWLLQVCRERGIQVPGQCAVVGVDNDSVVCGLSFPALASVPLAQQDMGFQAAEALDRMMRGLEPKKQVILAEPKQIVVRQSADLIAVDDPAICKAISFIQSNAYRQLNADEIARASGLYRRGLERRFRQKISMSVMAFYRQARAAHVASLLDDTNLSLEEIAELCDFSQASQLTRFFGAVKGVLPSAYRQGR